MNEHSFARGLCRTLRGTKYFSKIWKVNDTFEGGVPDLFLEGPRRDLWVELKWIKALPKRPTTLINLCNPRILSALQIQWLRRRARVRGDAVVLVGSPEGCILFQDLEWEIPLFAQDFRVRALPSKTIVTQLQNLT